MLLRFLSGLVGIPLLTILVFVMEGRPFVLGLAVITIIGLYEFYSGTRKAGIEPQEWLGLAAAFVFLLAARDEFSARGFDIPALLTLFVIATLAIEMLRKNRSPLKNIGCTFLGAVYVGWLFSYLVAINSIDGDLTLRLGLISVRKGGWMVLFIIFAAWAADTGAYLVGGKWGKHKMVPALSPGKSWEGAAAGLTASIAMSFLMGQAVGLPWIHLTVLGIIIAAASLIGDLAESSLKREIGIKDFGSILPGHGGILDRFDGLLFAAPLFYYYLKIFLGY